MKLEELGVKTDNRGSLVEAFKLPNDGQIFYVVVAPGQTRGNHYHLRKTERFLVVYGAAEISVRDRQKGTVMNVEVSGNKPLAVTITPEHTHNIHSKEGCLLLVWVDEQFSEDDPDTYGEEI